MWYHKLRCEAALNRFGVIQGLGKWAEFITNGRGNEFSGVRWGFVILKGVGPGCG